MDQNEPQLCVMAQAFDSNNNGDEWFVKLDSGEHKKEVKDLSARNVRSVYTLGLAR
jgi:hypothetical protein